MVEFLELATVELDEALTFYEGRAEGLGYRFLFEVQRAVAQFEAFPKSAPAIVHRKVPPGTRQLVLATFPYTIVFSEPESTVVAIAHQKRRPRYWLSRLRRGV